MRDAALIIARTIFMSSIVIFVGLIINGCLAHGQELSTFYTAEIYNQTGEVKSGFGLRARYWWEQWGIEADGMSLTPKDSIIDRSDLSLAWRYGFSRAGRRAYDPNCQSMVRQGGEAEQGFDSPTGASLILSAGIGANFEDDAWGPGGGAALQYNWGRIGAEIEARLIQEDYFKTLLTAGINWRF